MLTKIIREDGSILDSSVISSCVFTEQVNTGAGIEPGACVASTIEVTAFGSAPVKYGEKLTYIQVDSDTGDEDTVGVFYADKPMRIDKTRYKFTAYNVIVKLETDVTAWLDSIQGDFPMSCRALIAALADHVGVTVDTANVSDITVQAFTRSGVTARMIFSWAAQISGKFVIADYTGKIWFYWYALNPHKKIGFEPVVGDNDDYYFPTLDGGISGRVDYFHPLYNNIEWEKEYFPYFMDGLEEEDIFAYGPSYVSVTAPNSNVVVTSDKSIWSENGGTLSIVDNPLFCGMAQSEMKQVANNILDAAVFDAYKPCEVKTTLTRQIRVGMLVFMHRYEEVSSVAPGTNLFLVTKAVMDGHSSRFSSTGQESYDSTGYTASTASKSGAKSNVLKVNGVSPDGNGNVEIPAGGGPYYGLCTTAAGTAAKVVTCEGFVLETGAQVNVLMSNRNTRDNVTVNVNDTGAYDLVSSASDETSSYRWYPGEVVTLVFTGTKWSIVGKSIGSQRYAGIVSLSADVDDTSGVNDGYAATPSAVKAANDLAASAKWTALWENASPTSSFPTQSVTVSGLSEYSLFLITCRWSTSDAGLCSMLAYLPGTSDTFYDYKAYQSGSAWYSLWRGFYFNKSTNVFAPQGGHYNGAANDGYLIPVYLAGLKM